MAFTFRYFLSGIAGLLVASGCYIASRRKQSWIFLGRLFVPQVALLAVLFQIAQSIFVADHVKFVDISLTASNRRDGGLTVDRYSRYMDVLLEAGKYLRTITGPNDRVWIEVSLATGAITDAYLRNKFYAPNQFSKYEDLHQCNGPCLERFDYLLASPDERTWPEGFELQKRYSNIAILRTTKIKH
jgi:hypothetical protein